MNKEIKNYWRDFPCLDWDIQWNKGVEVCIFFFFFGQTFNAQAYLVSMAWSPGVNSSLQQKLDTDMTAPDGFGTI